MGGEMFDLPLRYQGVVKREVTVDAGFKSFHPQDCEVGFEGVAASGGGNRAQDSRFVEFRPDTLGGPQEEGQFIEGKRLRREAATALASRDGGLQVAGGDRP